MQSELNFPDTRYTFADFFAGCGGFSLGLIQAGMKCVSALEFNDDAAWTYWYNLCYKGWSHLWIDPENQKLIDKVKKRWKDGKTTNHLFQKGVPDNWLTVDEPMPCSNLFLMDITKLEPEDWMEIIGVRVGDIKVFIGGPPCQGFSTCGKREIGDERNKLALRMIYYAKICKPDYVLIENVPGLLTLGRKKGEKESPFVHWIREAFDDAGYDMSYKVHNAADYGVPQKRKRVLFFAVKRGVENKPLLLDKVEMQTTVLEAIGHLPPIQAGETWKGGTYTLEEREGYLICPNCLRFNQQTRTNCHNCKKEMEFSLKIVTITE
jgi:site-specific DNA-cytosine methylase